MDLTSMNINPKIKKACKKLSKQEATYMLSDIEGYREPLVDINQFIEDPEYLGGILKDENGKTKLFSIWVDALNKVFPNPYYSPYYEVAFSGAIGGGKSTVGRIILIYDLYKLLMLRNPFTKYQLIASDAIVMALLTANLNLAKLVLYRPFKELIRSSPFFMKLLLNKRKINEGGSIEFPNNISIQAGSRFTHALGLAVFCLKGDTRLPLLDGRIRTIEEVVKEFETNKDLYTYSLDIQTKSIVPGKIIKAVNNGTRSVYRVHFDNGKYIDATDNHPILMRNNKYKKVEDLSIGDSVMPFEMRINDDGYYNIVNPYDGIDRPVHKIIYEYKNGSIPVGYSEGLVQSHNHKIVSIEYLGEYDVFDLTIDKYHNFALDSGVVVHNSGLLDEASYQQEGESTHQAYDSYISMSRRMKSRFMEMGGGVPGHLCLISSKKDENAFLEAHIIECKDDPHFICFEYPLWEAHKDKGIYSGVTFTVFAGSTLQSPRIIEDGNITKYPKDKILNVPIEYQSEFKTNIEKALMDLAGTVTISSSKYIAFPENLMKAIRIVHCCNVTDHIILDFFDDKRIIEFVDVQKLKLYLNLLSNSPRYVHIDIGITDDSYGFAMSCVSGMREVEKFDVEELMDNPTGTGVVMRAEPVIRTELALSIRSTTRVPLWKVRDFIVDLTEMGFPIVKVTADSFQSEDTLQLLTKMGYETDTISLDKSKDPHLTFRNALYEGRCELPDFKLMIKEFTDLIDKGKKFDHSTSGTKDITDAVVGSHYTAFQASGSFIDIQ